MGCIPVCIDCSHNKRELYINVPGGYVLYVVIIRENCTSVHKRPWKVLCIGFNHNKRELYINIPEEYVLAYNIIRENCTIVHKRPR